MLAQTYTTLFLFGGGGSPRGTLVEGRDENLYGTTYRYGGRTSGIIFKINPGGTYTALHSGGGTFQAGLKLGTDGNFYRTSVAGGTYAHSCVYKITPSGTLTVLYMFDAVADYLPGGPVQATDGNFYGTTIEGGTNGHGTLFRITPSGTLTTIYKTRCAPDICIGTDEFHTPDALKNVLVSQFTGLGYAVAVNHSFSGVLVPSQFYRKDKRVQSAMIEVNGCLYMNESTGTKSGRFDEIRDGLSEGLSMLSQMEHREMDKQRKLRSLLNTRVIFLSSALSSALPEGFGDFPRQAVEKSEGTPCPAARSEGSHQFVLKPEDGFPHDRKPITLADCYRFNLTNPAVDLTLMAPGSMADLTATLETLEKGPMTAEEIIWMRRVGQGQVREAVSAFAQGITTTSLEPSSLLHSPILHFQSGHAPELPLIIRDQCQV